jgi:hypothetical protein
MRTAALLSIGERLKAETVLIFFWSSIIYKLIKIPFELIAFLLGVYYSIKKRDIILLTILIFFIFLPLSILPLTWKRYYYTVIPFIYILAGASLNIFKEFNKRAKI